MNSEFSDGMKSIGFIHNCQFVFSAHEKRIFLVLVEQMGGFTLGNTYFLCYMSHFYFGRFFAILGSHVLLEVDLEASEDLCCYH